MPWADYGFVYGENDENLNEIIRLAESWACSPQSLLHSNTHTQTQTRAHANSDNKKRIKFANMKLIKSIAMLIDNNHRKIMQN